MKFNLFAQLLIPLSVMALAPAAVFAQFGSGQQARQTDPNMGHFYMARQQITITDDGPTVNDKRTPPPVPGQQNVSPAGIPQGLPAARWTQFSPAAENPNLSTSLPKVSNGVPPKMPPGGPAGKSAKAGKLAMPTPRPAAVKPAPSTEAYAPYKKFAPDAAVTGASNSQSSSAVKGDVLHWARNGR
jgi:hypothetical protein